jgi:hypothetical protein
MNKTIWKVSGTSPAGEVAGQALRNAGIGMVEKQDWSEVATALQRRRGRVVVADAESVSRSPRAASRTAGGTAARHRASALARAAHAALGDGRLAAPDGDGRARRGRPGSARSRSCRRASNSKVRTIDRYLGAGNLEERH